MIAAYIVTTDLRREPTSSTHGARLPDHRYRLTTATRRHTTRRPRASPRWRSESQAASRRPGWIYAIAANAATQSAAQRSAPRPHRQMAGQRSCCTTCRLASRRERGPLGLALVQILSLSLAYPTASTKSSFGEADRILMTIYYLRGASPSEELMSAESS